MSISLKTEVKDVTGPCSLNLGASCLAAPSSRSGVVLHLLGSMSRSLPLLALVAAPCVSQA